MNNQGGGDPRVVLSTSSVYPETTGFGFELARDLGYDGVELMVGTDPASAEIAAVARLAETTGIPVTAVHAPTLLLTPRVWGTDPWQKLETAGQAATRFGADVVVVHPPFRWQRNYAETFTAGIRRLESHHRVRFAVENMYPWRGPGGGEIRAYAPSWDAALLDCDHLTLDLSHAAIARQSSLELVHDWGERLVHLHLTDGTPGASDDHLPPGQGNQDAAKVLSTLADAGFSGQVVVEVQTRSLDRPGRETVLAQSLAFARQHLRTDLERTRG